MTELVSAEETSEHNCYSVHRGLLRIHSAAGTALDTGDPRDNAADQYGGQSREGRRT